MIKLKIQDKYFNQILSGEKTSEYRTFKSLVEKGFIQKGDGSHAPEHYIEEEVLCLKNIDNGEEIYILLLVWHMFDADKLRLNPDDDNNVKIRNILRDLYNDDTIETYDIVELKFTRVFMQIRSNDDV